MKPSLDVSDVLWLMNDRRLAKDMRASIKVSKLSHYATVANSVISESINKSHDDVKFVTYSSL